MKEKKIGVLWTSVESDPNTSNIVLVIFSLYNKSPLGLLAKIKHRQYNKCILMYLQIYS